MVSRINAVSILVIIICVLLITSLAAWAFIGEDKREEYTLYGADSLVSVDDSVCSSPSDTALRVQLEESVSQNTMTYSFTAPESISGLHVYALFDEEVRTLSSNFSNSTYGYHLQKGSKTGELVVGLPKGAIGNQSWSISSPTAMRMVWIENGGVKCSPVARGNSTQTITTASDDRVLTTTPERGFVLFSKESPQETSRILSDGTEITLMVHENSSVDTTNVFTQLEQTNQAYSVGCEQNLTLFVIPKVQNYGFTGRATTSPIDMRGSAWVTSDSMVESERGSLYIHEYVHTRQCFRTEDDMKWIYEASATYYGGLLSSETRHNGSTRPTYSRGPHNGTLTNESDFNKSYRLDYTRGSRALLHLDYEIRTHSSKSLEDVMLWMNQQDHKISYSEFRTKIVSITDPETGEWMDSHIAGNETLPVHTEEYYYILPIEQPPDTTTPSSPRNSSKETQTSPP